IGGNFFPPEQILNKNMVEELSTVAIPNSVQEVLKDPRWRKDIQEEMDALKKN
ncbi:hypothetical protein Tco_0616782, partial [Tanacetum coccineum]